MGETQSRYRDDIAARAARVGAARHRVRGDGSVTKANGLVGSDAMGTIPCGTEPLGARVDLDKAYRAVQRMVMGDRRLSYRQDRPPPSFIAASA